jgi:hypothetical protein
MTCIAKPLDNKLKYKNDLKEDDNMNLDLFN